MITDGATVVLFKDDTKSKVFLVLRSDYPIWATMGGGLEKNETPKECAIREAYEETGFKVKIVRFVGNYIRRRNRITRSFLYEGRVVSGKFKPEFKGCKGKWFDVDKLPPNMLDRTRQKIVDCLVNQKKEFKKEIGPLSILSNLHLFVLQPIPTIKMFINFKK